MIPHQRHDEEFSAFVHARSAQLFRAAVLLTGNQPSAEDLVQAALTKAYVAWSRVRRADDPVAYVHGVLLKTFLSDRRRRASTELPSADPPEIGAPETDPTDRIAVLAALGDLAPLDRAVVVLRYWEDRSVGDAARVLGLSEAAVKNRSLRALRTLRSLLSDTPTSNGAQR